MSKALVAVGALLALGMGCGSDEPSVKRDEHARPTERAKVRAFYSGHSLTDGVPEEVLKIAGSLAPRKPSDFDFDFQSGGGALIRARSFGLDPAQPGSGYRFGRNRNGEGMDVVAEWKAPKTLKDGGPYNVLVITERHDLPWTIEHEQTVPALADYVQTFQGASPGGEVLLYHVWLERSGGPIADWLDYERDALPLWECVASAVNAKLPKDRAKLRVLPGATALAALVESVVKGDAPGVSGSEQERLALLFSDDVHFAPAGVYFMGLVHYAALFGESPEGAAAPAGISPELAAFMQKLAWRHVGSYAKRAESGASRSMAECAAYQDAMCNRYYQYRKPAGGSLADRARHMKNALVCGQSGPFT